MLPGTLGSRLLEPEPFGVEVMFHSPNQPPSTLWTFSSLSSRKMGFLLFSHLCQFSLKACDISKGWNSMYVFTSLILKIASGAEPSKDLKPQKRKNGKYLQQHDVISSYDCFVLFMNKYVLFWLDIVSLYFWFIYVVCPKNNAHTSIEPRPQTEHEHCHIFYKERMNIIFLYWHLVPIFAVCSGQYKVGCDDKASTDMLLIVLHWCHVLHGFIFYSVPIDDLISMTAFKR